MFAWQDDDDLDELADDESGGDEEDGDNSDAAIEATFREKRAEVLGSADLDELRRMRRNLQNALVNETLEGLAAARARDLVELLDDRIADLRARQMTARLG